MTSWEAAVEQARRRQGPTSVPETTSLNLDAMVKVSMVGPLPGYISLEELSLSNIQLKSLSNFPHLPQLQTLILSDNRISGGLDGLVRANLVNLTRLDLSNNRIDSLEKLAPLAQLSNLRSLHLLACPIATSRTYREDVFNLISSLQFLDDRDREGNEYEEDDTESEDDDDEEEDDEEVGEEGLEEEEGEESVEEEDGVGELDEDGEEVGEEGLEEEEGYAQEGVEFNEAEGIEEDEQCEISMILYTFLPVSFSVLFQRYFFYFVCLFFCHLYSIFCR